MGLNDLVDARCPILNCDCCKGAFEVVKYTENLKHIAAQVNVPSAWQETNVMTVQGDLKNVKDVNGTICIITGRAKGIIREALKRHLLVETHAIHSTQAILGHPAVTTSPRPTCIDESHHLSILRPRGVGLRQSYFFSLECLGAA